MKNFKEHDPKRMKKAVEYLQQYIATYDLQSSWENYSDGILIDDVLYALGVGLYGQEFEYSTGYAAWKDELRAFLGCEKTTFGAWVRAKDNDHV